MDELLAKGLKNAKNAILAGSSAGGYPAMLYCDRFRNLLTNTSRCLFAENIQQDIKTPIFILMSAFDNVESAPKAFADWYFDRNYTYLIDERDLPLPNLIPNVTYSS
ncbi:hypothetical protein RND71_037134 [Anisodus tanguticus]|uniref:Pectin acetylesterase n=1 Tax=Anisodus tanguticus TaxID=243964 RepID=A0AAE1R2H7_9SOLA|nr:hypothetical protein RND71_037134 [Anisodus tanguticus]